MKNFHNTDALSMMKDMADNTVDLTLTDPPYVISKASGMQEAKDRGENVKQAVTTDFGAWDRDFKMEDLESIINEVYRVTKNSGTAIFFFDIWKITILKEIMENAGFKGIRFIEWVKTNPVPINSKTNYLTNSREIALTGVKKSKPTFHSEYDKGIYEYPIFQPKGMKRFHPTQKSIPLFDELIRKHSNEADLVMDCFAGSGTTAISCLNTNREFVGCEVSKEYYDKALDYIAHYHPKQNSVFDLCK